MGKLGWGGGYEEREHSQEKGCDTQCMTNLGPYKLGNMALTPATLATFVLTGRERKMFFSLWLKRC